jgi:hypothetical protein
MSLQNVYLNKRKLTFERDFTYDATTAQLTLDELAEFNVAPVRSVTGSLTFTSASRVVTGTSSFFKKEVAAGDWITRAGQDVWFEVSSVDSDTQITLRTTSTYTLTGAALQKQPEIYEEGSTVLSADVIGTTEDGLPSGILIKQAPQIVKDLLTRGGLSSLINNTSFESAKDIYYHKLGLAIPKKFSDTSIPKLRDSINEINQSVFGSLYQDANFQLAYNTLRPRKPTSTIQLKKFDLVSFSIKADSSRIVRAVNVKYGFKEYDPQAATNINSIITYSGRNATYLAKTTKEIDVTTLLAEAESARIYASRWAFILETASATIKLNTKMKLVDAQIQDIVDLEHDKLYERIGSSANRKIAAVQESRRTLSDSNVELEDLANAFSRCAIITEDLAEAFAESSDLQKTYNGYITDTYGMQNNDPESFGVNLIW